jgi:hypothetical protein
MLWNRPGKTADRQGKQTDSRKNGKLSADTLKKQPLLHFFYSPIECVPMVRFNVAQCVPLLFFPFFGYIGTMAMGAFDFYGY